MNWMEKYHQGLPYTEFLDKYGTPSDKDRWQSKFDQVQLNDAQKELLSSFRRKMHVLVRSGAWCGDCVNQCPIFEHFVQASSAIEVRYIDRDAHPDVSPHMQINAGDRVPSLVFLSEDGHVVGRHGDRTLSQYRSMMKSQASSDCPSVLVVPDTPLLEQVTQDWLDEFERIQWILRLSGRLRQKHGD